MQIANQDADNNSVNWRSRRSNNPVGADYRKILVVMKKLFVATQPERYIFIFPDVKHDRASDAEHYRPQLLGSARPFPIS
ncbi:MULTISPECIES: hypothetical protein [unclassified Microcoleus]|uniref:hypothetical protein n=1 Tax=unclassified Microcoleus TaxID=2642155 RepID=UPI002FD6959D